MPPTGQDVRRLGPGDLSAFLALAGRDPVVNVFAISRARVTNLEPRWLGGEVWGRFVDGRLVAACHVGANLVPVGCTEEDMVVFARQALRRRAQVVTIVGPEAPVEAFWGEVAEGWGPARDIRRAQPHLRIDSAPLVEPDPRVRVSRRADLATLYPACVAMFTEEVGVSPETTGGADLYRARVSQLIAKGWSFARYEGDRVLFKAEVGCTAGGVAQVQGVYVDPDLRGEGLGTAGMAAVVALVRERVAGTVSLYVNDWNVAARRAYERVGFRETARFTTIMF